MIDLRSDTLTKPTSGMRRAMAEAEVGDDVYAEDPTVTELQERVAAMFGKDAALFTPTGSMANVLAVGALVAPGQEVICEARAHIVRADPGFARSVEEALKQSGAAPENLRLEVTESAMTQDPEGALRVLAELRKRAGVSAYLDDFGTGASSLRFLHRFPGDALKVDRGLVIDMLTDPGSHEIVKAIVGLAHNLGMEVVGEGVESAEHLERLRVFV